MKLCKTIRLVALLLIVVCSSIQASASIFIGYCEEDVTTSKLNNSSTTATISCAIALTPEKLSPFRNYSISNIRVGITDPDKVTSLRIWVRQSLSDTTAIASADVDLSVLTEGWNSLPLNQAVPIDGQQTLYCGYSYTQSDHIYLPTSGTKNQEGSFWIAVNENWSDYCKKQKPICLQAGLISPYSNAIILSDCQLERSYVNPEDPDKSVNLLLSVNNRGMQPLQHFQIAYQLPDAQIEKQEVVLSEPLSLGETADCSLSIPIPEGLTGPDQSLPLSVILPNGAENETDSLAHDTLYFEVGKIIPIDPSMPILVEEFTSLNNGYAPAGQYHLREVLEQSQRPTILISRHEGYGPNDKLHPSNSDYSTSFFGPQALNFVPAVWFDRQGVPISSTLPNDSLLEYLSSANSPRYASISFGEPTYDSSTRNISVEIEVVLHSISVAKNPTLIVCFTENSISTPEQKNYFPDRYDGSIQSDIARNYASITNNGALFPNEDLDAIAHGRKPIAQFGTQRRIATLLISNDINIEADELYLVAYVSDQGDSHQLLGVAKQKITLK